ncbi:LysR family transcriptional regulator [Streptomyces sp. NPDC057616]|uniref:LysR family transcriptional regulator n=1 Tax=Streptomyces sp. NPDC057616 TaxID=3346183 RepID=UPI00368B04A7
MELRQLACFVTVAEELHFGRAAERLHIVQSAVSMQIQRLERELGAELFDRTPRRVRLTAAGQRLLPEARTVLAAAERARAAVAPPQGLRLGTGRGPGTRLDRVLAAFALRAPDVPVELVALPAGERLARVADGQLDAAFVRAVEPVPGVRVLPLWPDPLVAALPAGHPLAGRAEIGVGELAGLPLSLTERRNNPALVDLVVGACREAGFEPLTGRAAGSLRETLAAVGSRPSWTVVYASHARVLRSPRVAFVPFRAPGLALPAGLAVPAAAPPPHLDALLLACGDHEG